MLRQGAVERRPTPRSPPPRRPAGAHQHARRGPGAHAPERPLRPDPFEFSQDQEHLLVPQLLVVTVEEQAGGTGPELSSVGEIEPGDTFGRILARAAPDAVGAAVSVPGVQEAGLEDREFLLDVSPHGPPPGAIAQSRPSASRRCVPTGRRCRTSCSTSPSGGASASSGRTSRPRAGFRRAASSTRASGSGSSRSCPAPRPYPARDRLRLFLYVPLPSRLLLTLCPAVCRPSWTRTTHRAPHLSPTPAVEGAG